jgi:hypothetical protein
MAATPSLATFVTGELRRFIRRKARAFALFAIAGLAAAVMIGYLIAAGYTAIEQQTSPILADLILAGIMAVLAIVLAVVGAVLAKTPKRQKVMARAVAAGVPLAVGLARRRIPWGLIGSAAAGLAAAAVARAAFRSGDRR